MWYKYASFLSWNCFGVLNKYPNLPWSYRYYFSYTTLMKLSVSKITKPFYSPRLSLHFLPLCIELDLLLRDFGIVPISMFFGKFCHYETKICDQIDNALWHLVDCSNFFKLDVFPTGLLYSWLYIQHKFMRIQKEFLNHHSQKNKAKQRGLFLWKNLC